jgi:hypothetical protein
MLIVIDFVAHAGRKNERRISEVSVRESKTRGREVERIQGRTVVRKA